MEVQVFLQEELVHEPPEVPEAERLVVESGISFHKAQAELAQETGFEAQARLHAREVEEFQKQLLPALPFPVVSEVEYKVWQLFLPASYPRSQWAGYRFDLIPPDVLEVVRRYGHLFDEMEIRTPEVGKSDPVIFGTRGRKRYLVARWAESRLIPFEEVAKTVLSEFYTYTSALVAGLFFSITTLGILALGVIAASSWVFSLLAVFPAFFAAGSWFNMVEKRDRKKELVKALALSV